MASGQMVLLPWDILVERCAGATEAVIVAPYVKLGPLVVMMDKLASGASVQCITRWTPLDIQIGSSDLDCRNVVVDRGGSFRLHNRLHAKYYRFDDQVLVGSANLTAAGLSYARYGNLEILCEPGPPFVPAVFEATLKQQSTEVSDADFLIWQQCPINERPDTFEATDTSGRSLDDWKPQTRNPAYLWLSYCGDDAEIVSDEQRAFSRMDLDALDIPPGLTSESFQSWILLSLQASPFIDSVRRFDFRTDAVVWDSVSADWAVNRSTAARWVSTAHNWLRFFAS